MLRVLLPGEAAGFVTCHLPRRLGRAPREAGKERGFEEQPEIQFFFSSVPLARKEEAGQC